MCSELGLPVHIRFLFIGKYFKATVTSKMSKHKVFKPHFGRRGDWKNLPAEYIQDHMEDEDINSALVSPPLKYIARINSFGTSETNEELER